MSRAPLLLQYVVATVVLAGCIGFGLRPFYRPEPRDRSSETRAAEAKRQPDPSLALGAQTVKVKSSSMIHLHWNPSAEPVRRSSHAMLYIYDGGTPHKQVLGRHRLDIGSTDYKPTSDEITFHLILSAGRPEGEFLLVLLGSQVGSERNADAFLLDGGLDSSK